MFALFYIVLNVTKYLFRKVYVNIHANFTLKNGKIRVEQAAKVYWMIFSLLLYKTQKLRKRISRTTKL